MVGDTDEFKAVMVSLSKLCYQRQCRPDHNQLRSIVYSFIRICKDRGEDPMEEAKELEELWGKEVPENASDKWGLRWFIWLATAGRFTGV